MRIVLKNNQLFPVNFFLTFKTHSTLMLPVCYKYTLLMLKYALSDFRLQLQSSKLYNNKYIYGRFNINDKHWSFHIHSCSSFQVIKL